MAKKSFFERLTGSVNVDEYEPQEEIAHIPEQPSHKLVPKMTHSDKSAHGQDWQQDDGSVGQLTVDVYQTQSDIVIKTMVAGVKREDMDISLSRDMVTIQGSRQEERNIPEDDYFHKELYWGTFSRTILLPHEVDVEGAEAFENNGLLTIKLPKIDKSRQTKLKVKSI